MLPRNFTQIIKMSSQVKRIIKDKENTHMGKTVDDKNNKWTSKSRQNGNKIIWNVENSTIEKQKQ